MLLSLLGLGLEREVGGSVSQQVGGSTRMLTDREGQVNESLHLQ